ncbi:MAG: 23S rRNA (uracil(1939)-C(5))-methyltransferase RlmD [Lachnospiraceae bacterium]|nr:23S rRNA (uracil(1939)-C(5))-methyltransferase RlmD [Lachnospiraceae bacterium]
MNQRNKGNESRSYGKKAGFSKTEAKWKTDDPKKSAGQWKSDDKKRPVGQWKSDDRRKTTGTWHADDKRKTDENPRQAGRSVQTAKRQPKVPGAYQCPVAHKCGSCAYMGTLYSEQLKTKEKFVAEQLKPFGKCEPIVGMKDPRFYRNKVHAAFGWEKGTVISGTYQESTHKVVSIETCLLENQKADAIIGTIRKLLPSFKIKTYDENSEYGLFRRALVRVAQSTGEIMVVLVLTSPILPSKNNFVKALRKEHPEITTIIVNVNDKHTSMILGDKEQVIYGKGYIVDELCGKTFKISAKSFYQINPVQTEVLYGLAMEYAGLTGKEKVLDAYCGIGTIGLVASDKAAKVIGVELNRDAVRDAVVNAKLNQVKNIDFYEKDAGEFLLQMAAASEKLDVIFMDPPRNGSDENFLSAAVTCAPEKIVYISCNVETQARDLQYLTKHGYRFVKGRGVDMFPFTGHVECVVLMSRVEK